MTDPNAARFAAIVEQVFEAFEDLLDGKPYPPTRAEICEHTGLNDIRVRRAVDRLKEQGRLAEGDGPRTLHIPY